MLISIIIPCYNSEHMITETVGLVRDEFRNNAGLSGYSCEFILVNDCSSDGTWESIKCLSKRFPEVHGINLMRNFGQHNALMCGLNFASGDYCVGMDDDLQTHPSQLQKIVRKMEEGYDIVYGIYPQSTNRTGKRMTSWLNKVTSRILLGRPKEIESSNFWMITKSVRDQVILYRNYSPYVDGIFFRCSHNIGNVPIEHHKRAEGESGYTFKKLLKLWMAYWNFSVIPLRAASVIGVVTSAAGFIAAIVTVIHKLLDPTTTIGWSSLVCILLIFFGLVLMVLGVIGEYIGEIVLSINSTPQYIIRDKVNL